MSEWCFSYHMIARHMVTDDLFNSRLPYPNGNDQDQDLIMLAQVSIYNTRESVLSHSGPERGACEIHRRRGEGG